MQESAAQCAGRLEHQPQPLQHSHGLSQIPFPTTPLPQGVSFPPPLVGVGVGRLVGLGVRADVGIVVGASVARVVVGTGVGDTGGFVGGEGLLPPFGQFGPLIHDAGSQ